MEEMRKKEKRHKVPHRTQGQFNVQQQIQFIGIQAVHPLSLKTRTNSYRLAD
jgi:hypothetical protein